MLRSTISVLFRQVLLVALCLPDSSSWLIGDAHAKPPPADRSAARRVEIRVDERGFHPSRVEVPANRVVELAFRRTSDEGCGQRVVFPGRGIERELPLDRVVVVELEPARDETIAFTCGMGMYKGSIVVVSHAKRK